MVEKLLYWFRGYLLCYVKSYSIERFINLCRGKEIELKNLKKTSEGYQFYVALKNYKSIKPIAKKTKVVPYIKKRYGCPFFLHRYRKRKGLFVGIALFVTLIYIMSLYIWNISIEGGYKYTKEAILEFVNEQQVYTGVMKSKIDCTKLEEQIRLRYKDISWVSAEIRGTRLIIKFTETNMPMPRAEARGPSDIIATKSGIVTEIITRNGTPKVRNGDVIKKGDVLVSGLVDVVGDFDVLMRQKPVVADADIKCKSYYDYKESFPMKYTKKIFTGKQKTKYKLQVLNKKISLYSPRISYDNYDIITDEAVLKLSWDFYLPFSTKKIMYREYLNQQKVYTEEEAKQIAMKRLKEYLDELTSHGVEIIENNVKIEIKNNQCTASGKIIVFEPCWEYREIQSE